MKKILVIYNPVAGKSSKRPSKLAIKRGFDANEFDVTLYETTCTGDAINVTTERAPEYDIVVACGGDGTLNEVANGLLKAGVNVPIGYIPMGSTNDFANTLGIPSVYYDAIKTITDGHTNDYDVCLFNDRCFNYVACCGPGASVSYSTPQSWKNKLGYSAYMFNAVAFHFIPVLMELKPRHTRVEYDGRVFEGGAHYIAVSNSTSVAGLFKFGSQHIVLNDGMFELLIVKDFSIPGAIPLLASVLSGDYENDSLIFVKAKNIKISWSDAQPWTLDGEYGGEPSGIEFSVKQKAIKIFSPENPLFE